MSPWKYSPAHTSLPPMRSEPAPTSMVPVTAALETSTPLMNTRCVVPSYVVARCTHAPLAIAAFPRSVSVRPASDTLPEGSGEPPWTVPPSCA